MKFYFSFIGLICIFSTYQVRPAAKLKDNSEDSFARLFQERIEDLVIFNEIEERAWDFDIPLFETKKHKEGLIFTPFGFSLMSSLDNLQTVFCTKFLFKNYIFLSQIWPDLLHLDVLSFRGKYKDRVDNLSDQELNLIIKAAQEIDLICSDHQSSKSEADKKITISNLLSQLPVDPYSLYYSFLFSKGYQKFKEENKYHIYEINEYFLLFFPKEKLNRAMLAFSQNKNKYKDEFFMFRNFNQFCEIYFGLNIPLSNPFTYLESNFSVTIPHAQDDFIGDYLIDGLQKLFVNNYLWKIRRQKELLPAYLLPRFNIVLGGHGHLEEYLMELTPVQIKTVLSFLNHHVWTKTLLLESCYMGGVNFKNIFGHSYQMLNQFTENLNYTILFEGTLYNVTAFFSMYEDWINYNKNINFSLYSTFFDALSLDQTDYLKIIEKLHNSLAPENRISNYVSIKFPNTGWIMVNDYQKEVFNITNSKVAASYTAGKIQVPDDKNLILMNTNIIPIEILVNKKMDMQNEMSFCEFLPVHYMNQNYYIKKLVAKNIENIVFKDPEISFAKILSYFFKFYMVDIEEPINIIIDQVVFGQYPIYNVLIEWDTKKIYFDMPKLFGGQSVYYDIDRNRIKINKFNLKEKIDLLKAQVFKDFEKNSYLNMSNPEFLTTLEATLKAKQLPRLNPKAKSFISKIQSIQL